MFIKICFDIFLCQNLLHITYSITRFIYRNYYFFKNIFQKYFGYLFSKENISFNYNDINIRFFDQKYQILF